MLFLRLKHQFLARLFALFPSLTARWAERLPFNTSPIPWTPTTVPLALATVALISTGGTHLVSDAPFSMGDPDGDPTLRRIPVVAPLATITITHDYYNHRDAEQDLNLVLPIERLQELVEAGIIGRLHHTAYGLMGHINGRHLTTLQEVTARQIAEELQMANVDYALLIPA